MRKKKPPTDLQKLIHQYAGEREAEWYGGDGFGWWLDLDKDSPVWPWLKAIAAIDRTKGKNKEPLIELLRSGTELPPKGREYLVDLLERYKLDKAAELLRGPFAAKRAQLADLLQLQEFKLRGRPGTPLYDMSDTDAALLWAEFNLNLAVMGKGWAEGLGPMDSKAALKWVAPNPQFADRITKVVKRGKHASYRRSMKKRRT